MNTKGARVEVTFGRALLWAACVALILAGVALTTGLRPEPARPCERWEARSPLRDLVGCQTGSKAKPYGDGAEARAPKAG